MSAVGALLAPPNATDETTRPAARGLQGLAFLPRRLQPQLLLPRGDSRWTLRLTPATLVAVRGRPTLASAVSQETVVGDQLNETGTAAQTRARENTSDVAAGRALIRDEAGLVPDSGQS
jgi:hypothetical protein